MKPWRIDGFMRRRIVAAALAFLIPAIAAGWPNTAGAESQSPVTASFSPEKLELAGEYILREIANGKIAGAVLMIQQHAHPVYFKSFGVRDIENKRPMTADTIFRLYSMSKAVTSVAAMMLVEDGKLALDDPVSKYIPAFADAKVGVDVSDEAGQYPLKLEPLKRPITIRDLLRHTSGITYGFFGETA